MTQELVHASLYNIESAIVSLFELREEAIAEGDAEQIAVLDKEIDQWVSQEIRKVDGIVGYIRECESRAAIAKAEADRLKERAKDWEARAERIRASALAAMQAHDVKLLESPTNALKRQANGGVQPVEITDIEKVPAQHKTITVTLPLDKWQALTEDTWAEGLVTSKGRIAPDRDSIRKALKEHVRCPECRGEAVTRGNCRCERCDGNGYVPNTVPGARLAERGEHLRIE